LRRYCEASRILTDDAKQCLKLSLDGVADYKKYRDLIIHSTPFDAPSGIGQHFNRKAEPIQVLLTKEALSALFQRMEILTEELRFADLLFRLGDEEGAKSVYPHERDPLRLRRERDVPQVVRLVLQHQKRRLSLSPLPTFPSEQQIQAAQEDFLRQQSQQVPAIPQRNSNATVPDRIEIIDLSGGHDNDS
jgi:hypothetical protein